MMKRCHFLYPLLVIFTLMALVNIGYAEATVSGDVSLTLSTDKQAYTSSENIKETLTLTNNSTLPISNVFLEISLPEGYVVVEGNSTTKSADQVAGNSSLVLTTVITPVTIPQTGDNSNIVMWLVLLVIAACGLAGLFVLIAKRRNKPIAFLLILALLLSGSAGTISAARADVEDITLEANTVVQINGARRTLKAKAAYSSADGNDNLQDDIIDAGDIEILIERGLIEVIYDEGGKILSIDGCFSNKKVRNAQEAADLLNSAASLFGRDFYASSADISVNSNNLEPNDGKEIFYRYSPKVNGLPVLGSQTILFTDGTGNIIGLTNSYDNAINSVYTSADTSKNNAEENAFNQLISEEESGAGSLTEAATGLKNAFKFDTNLVIYAADDRFPIATVYQVHITTAVDSGNMPTEEELDSTVVLPFIDKTYYIYANGENAGSVHSSIDNIETADNISVTAADFRNVDRTIRVQKDGNKYKLKDTQRNLETYRTQFKSFLWWNWVDLPGKLVEATSATWNSRLIDAIDISAHANMEAVYDLYRNVLGRNSFDGNGGKIKSSTEYADSASQLYYNAYWSPAQQQMVFGNDGHFAVALDVCGHEFTHAVINYVVGDGVNTSLTYYGESGALNEALADIMGSLIEDKSGNGRWLIAEDSDSAIRNMSRPSQYGDPEHYNNRYTGTGDNAGVHTNSAIINFAAYKMMTDSRTSGYSTNDWAKLFYKSMYRLPTDANFLTFRGAVINTSKRLGFNHDQQQAIKDAFDAVGVTEPESVRIVLSWGSEPEDLDSHLVGPGVNGNRFHVYYQQRSYDRNGQYDSENSLYLFDLDYDDTTSYGPEVTTIHTFTPATYYFYVHDYTNRDSTDSATMSNSGATVKIYKGTSSSPLATFKIRPGQGGIYWNVCSIKISTGGYVTVNKIDTYGYSETYQ